MSHLFAEKTWPELEKAIQAQTLLLLPFGQTEEHACHLQVGSDTIIAERVAQAVAEKLAPEIPALILPAIPYGYAPKATARWPGTFRIRWRVAVEYLADVCCSAIEMGFRKLAVISTHGPHGDISRLAAREVFDKTGVGIVITQPQSFVAKTFASIRKSALGGAAHAGEYETSLMMHFGYPVDLTGTNKQDMVKTCNEWVAGDMAGSGKVSWSTWALQTPVNGGMGDPTCADAETGKLCMETIIEEYCRFLKYFWEHETPVQQQ